MLKEAEKSKAENGPAGGRPPLLIGKRYSNRCTQQEKGRRKNEQNKPRYAVLNRGWKNTKTSLRESTSKTK